MPKLSFSCIKVKNTTITTVLLLASAFTSDVADVHADGGNYNKRWYKKDINYQSDFVSLWKRFGPWIHYQTIFKWNFYETIWQYKKKYLLLINNKKCVFLSGQKQSRDIKVNQL